MAARTIPCATCAAAEVRVEAGTHRVRPEAPRQTCFSILQATNLVVRGTEITAGGEPQQPGQSILIENSSSVTLVDPNQAAQANRLARVDEQGVLASRTMLCVHARAASPATTAMQVVVLERDGTPWGANSQAAPPRSIILTDSALHSFRLVFERTHMLVSPHESGP